jgi:serine protease AprX
VLEVAAPSAWRQLGVTGKGIGVAVVDSGIAPHPDLAGRIVAAVDFTSAPTDPSSSTQALVVPADPGGHGTHVAGLIAGDGTASGGAYTGVAPGANLIDVRVITAQGTTTASMLIRGLQWVLANRYTYNIRVVNISAGGKTTTSYRDDPLAAAVEVLIFAGITVVVSAGNDGPGDMTITSPGTDPYVITVGAVDDNATATVADDSVASWSSRGPTRDGLAKPDIAAPGRKIVSLRAPGSTLDLLLPQRMVAGLDPLNPQYFTLSGTSAAAPIVTGVVALMLERDPSLKPLQVKNRLRSTATPLAFGSPYTTGAGLANALAAVSASDRWSGRWPSVSYGFAQRVYRDVYGQRLVWLDLAANGGVDSRGQRWSGVTWDNVAWDSVTWENLDWSAFNWLCIDITWEATISWQDMTWEDITWEVKYSRGQNKRTWAVVN